MGRDSSILTVPGGTTSYSSQAPRTKWGHRSAKPGRRTRIAPSGTHPTANPRHPDAAKPPPAMSGMQMMQVKWSLGATTGKRRLVVARSALLLRRP
eukprot:286853-Prymnesium_polylepis.2